MSSIGSPIALLTDFNGQFLFADDELESFSPRKSIEIGMLYTSRK